MRAVREFLALYGGLIAFYGGIAAVVFFGTMSMLHHERVLVGVFPPGILHEDVEPFNAERHVCVGVDVPAKQVFESVSAAKSELDVEVIVQQLQGYVKDDASYTVLQDAAEYLFNEQSTENPIPLEQFIAAVQAACTARYGQIADRNHV